MRPTRRELLQLPAVTAPLLACHAPREFTFRRDHIMGTSFDFTVIASTHTDAQTAERIVLKEISRLCRTLSTYDPNSEISKLNRTRGALPVSPELFDLLALYETWRERTDGAFSASAAFALNRAEQTVERLDDHPLDVNAIGKPFILSRALVAARRQSKGVTAMLLDIGGDIAAIGQPWKIAVGDPQSPFENAPPLSVIHIADGAVATSSTALRGGHIFDRRTGNKATALLSATAIAPDAVTANALSTACFVFGIKEGLALISRTPGAECLLITPAGLQFRSPGFSRFEQRRHLIPAAYAPNWPAGFEMRVGVNIKANDRFRPYVAVWVQDSGNQLVRNIFVIGTRKWLNELHAWWDANENNANWAASTHGTRAAGHYTYLWDGLDENYRPVSQGTYKINVETAIEHGPYFREFSRVDCTDTAKSVSVKSNDLADNCVIEYGPRKRSA